MPSPRNREPAAIVCAVCLLLSACASVPPMGASDKIFGYALVEVEVEASEDAYTGLFERMDDLDDDEFRQEVETKLKAALTEVLGSSFTGTMPARVFVHVDEMEIASGAGRALLGSGSFVGANVRVVDMSSGEVLAEKHFREREKDVSFGGNIGVLVEITKNIADAALNDRVEQAAREFAEAVKDWMDS